MQAAKTAKQGCSTGKLLLLQLLIGLQGLLLWLLLWLLGQLPLLLVLLLLLGC